MLRDGRHTSGLCALACAFCLLVANRGEALRVEVFSRSLRQGGPGECSVLRFSDGSEVVIGAGAVLRIAALRARGVDLELSRGSVRVSNQPGTFWRLLAGDYRLVGNGASFDVDFDPERRSLDLDLESGSAFVSGPATRAEVNAGDHLVVQSSPDPPSLEGRRLSARCSPGDAEPEGQHQ